MISYAAALSEEARTLNDAGSRTAGVALQNALRDLSNLMGGTFNLKGSTVQGRFRSYASDHRYDYQG